MSPPEFSVIVPVYNGARFLMEALDSVAQQTFVSWECLIIDDGSEDDSVALSEAWARQGDHPVKILHHPQRENRGLPETRNLGAKHASGRWLAFLDQDDLWKPEKLSVQKQFLSERKDIVAVSCYPELTYDKVEPDMCITLWANSIKQAAEDVEGSVPFAKFLTGCPFFMSGAVTSVQAFDSIGGFQSALPRTSDWLFWASLASRHPLAVIREPLGVYRYHGGNEMAALLAEPLGIATACLEIHHYLADWLALDRGLTRAQAFSVVNAAANWKDAASDCKMTQENWWKLLAGTTT